MTTLAKLLVVAALLLDGQVRGQPNGEYCRADGGCDSGCCDGTIFECVVGSTEDIGATCYNYGGCTCKSGACVDNKCVEPACSVDSDCLTGCCGGFNDICQAAGQKENGGTCYTRDGCDCKSGICEGDSDSRVCKTEAAEPACSVDSDCLTGCCGGFNDICQAAGQKENGGTCYTRDGCDCKSGICEGDSDSRVCKTEAAEPACSVDSDCLTGCCGGFNDICQAAGQKENGGTCYTRDGCDCKSGICEGGSDSRVCKTKVCPEGTDTCDDPHMQGLRGQKIDWSGVDGGWYCLVKDEKIDLQVNVRLTAPLPADFPDRQLITGISVLSEGHSLVVEARNAYSVVTEGCLGRELMCLADGGLRVTVDGVEVNDLLRPARETHFTDGISLTASNLPVECRQFGGDKIWARMHEEMLQGRRSLAAASSTFEDWVLQFDDMAAHDWCTKYISERGGLADVQSNHAVFKIVTPDVVVRLNAGVNQQGGNGEVDWDGRVLPDLDFWQMDVGVHGLSLEHDTLTGILGETARPVLDNQGRDVMKGDEAIRGTVEDYRVSDALGVEFSLINTRV